MRWNNVVFNLAGKQLIGFLRVLWIVAIAALLQSFNKLLCIVVQPVRVDFGGTTSIDSRLSSSALDGSAGEPAAGVVKPSSLEPGIVSLDAKSVDEVSKTLDAASVVAQQNQDTVNSDDNGFSAPFVSSKRLRKSAATKSSVKRNPSEVFEKLGDANVDMPFKVVKIEKP